MTCVNLLGISSRNSSKAFARQPEKSWGVTIESCTHWGSVGTSEGTTRIETVITQDTTWRISKFHYKKPLCYHTSFLKATALKISTLLWHCQMSRPTAVTICPSEVRRITVSPEQGNIYVTLSPAWTEEARRKWPLTILRSKTHGTPILSNRTEANYFFSTAKETSLSTVTPAVLEVFGVRRAGSTGRVILSGLKSILPSGKEALVCTM